MTAEVIQIFHINTKVKLNNGKANLEFELIVHENAPKLRSEERRVGKECRL